MNQVIFIAMLLWIADTASAGEIAYTCQVKHVYSLEKQGELKSFPDSPLEKLMKENSFSVSRKTGMFIGNSAALDTSRAKFINVINKGSKDNSFKAIADFGGFENGNHPFQFIEIDEFIDGTEKPFVLMATEVGIITGTCK